MKKVLTALCLALACSSVMAQEAAPAPAAAKAPAASADKVEGVQLGLVNRAESAYGFQVGGVNVIRDSELAFFPILNIGFDLFPNY